jgi:hypothetical protein
MSVKIMGMVWDLEIGRDEKLVLLAYADHADHSGENIFPSVSRIARKTGYSERSVQSITRRLEEAGLLVSEGHGPHGTNKYHIPLCGGAISARVQDETARGAEMEAQGCKKPAKGVQPIAPESLLTVLKPSINACALSPEEIEEITQKEKAREIAELERAQSPNAWRGREQLPEPIRDLLDVYVQITGQRPAKGQLMDWLATGQEWLEIGITATDLRNAYGRANPPDGRGFLVTRPGSLTSTAGAIAGERRRKGNPEQSIEDKIRNLSQS